MNKKDLIIVGGGPIGLACGLAAQRAGLDYLILEKGTLVNSLFHYPLYMTFFSTSERLEIGDLPFTCIKPKPGRQEALEYYRKVVIGQNLRIELFNRVQNVQKQTDGSFKIEAEKGIYFTRKVVVASGFYDFPNLMNVPGEDLPKVRHYYREPHEYAFQKVAVIGAQNSGADAALQTFRKGAKVSLFVRGGEVGEHIKYWIRPDLENRIKEGSIKAYFHSEILEITEHHVQFKTPDGIQKIENDFVLAMTGYHPDNLFLKNMGIQFTEDEKKRPHFNPDTMETNVPGLYLAGVVCAGADTHLLMIENSRVHAERIIKDVLETRR